MIKYKNFNKIIIISCITIFLIVVGFNYFLDPYYVFGKTYQFNEYKPRLDKNQRISRIPELKLYNKNLSTIWIGSSRTGWNTNEKYEKTISNANIKNMTLNDCSLTEAIIMAKNAIFIHPEIKTIYFGIDFSMFAQNNKTNTALKKIQNKQITKEELLPLLCSFDTFNNSLKTLVSNIKKPEHLKIKYGEQLEYNEKIYDKFQDTILRYYQNYYKNFEFDTEKLIELKQFIQWANLKQIKVVIFATTMHVTERIAIYEAQKLNDFYRYKLELAKIQPYYDFAIINSYTTDKIHPEMQYFRDAIHSYPFLRKKISRKLFGYDEDFGQLVTKDNVKQLNQEDKKQLDKYIEQNPELVSQVKEWCE